MRAGKNLVFIRRNRMFNKMIIDYAEKYLSFSDYTTVSEYKNADIYINLRRYDINDLSSDDWKIIHESMNIEEVILKDRLLRNIEFIEAKELLFKAVKFFIELFKDRKYNRLVTYPVDNYITDIMVKIARHFDVKVYGISNFFIQGYKRITVYGENTKVRDVNKAEVELVLNLLQNQFKSYMALSYLTTLKNSILYYFKYKVRYLYFYLFLYKILGRLEYDYRSTPYSASVRSIKNFFPFKYFTNILPEFTEKSIYIPMHYHPEATIEHWSDDVKNVDYLTSLFKSVRYFSDNGLKVYLKEHPAMCFRQDISVYKKLKKIKNVEILNPFIETPNILDLFDDFAIWTGSTGVEALINGKNVYFASSNYYFQKSTNDLFEKQHLQTDEEKSILIEKILSNTIKWK